MGGQRRQVPGVTREPLHFEDLGLSSVALQLGPFALKWYALSYVAMLLLGWLYIRRMLKEPGAPMTRDQADDLITYIGVGVIAGGRLGYATFYRPGLWLDPLAMLRLWEGGMAFHGGLIGVVLALLLFARNHRLDAVRIADYIACCTPFGLVLVRLANFVNGELWGRPTDLPWGMTFPGAGDGLARHPSQLYEALFEGVVMAVVLWWLFWRTDARLRPGRLLGTGLMIYGIARFSIEMVRQPNAGMEQLGWGLTMGQTLSLPMVLAGAWLLMRSFQGTRAGTAAA